MFRVFSFLVISFLLSAPVFAEESNQDSWSIDCVRPDGPFRGKFRISVENGKFSGAMSSGILPEGKWESLEVKPVENIDFYDGGDYDPAYGTLGSDGYDGIAKFSFSSPRFLLTDPKHSGVFYLDMKNPEKSFLRGRYAYSSELGSSRGEMDESYECKLTSGSPIWSANARLRKEVKDMLQESKKALTNLQQSIAEAQKLADDLDVKRNTSVAPAQMPRTWGADPEPTTSEDAKVLK